MPKKNAKYILYINIFLLFYFNFFYGLRIYYKYILRFTLWKLPLEFKRNNMDSDFPSYFNILFFEFY
jgi:hypothetical protein